MTTTPDTNHYSQSEAMADSAAEWAEESKAVRAMLNKLELARELLRSVSVELAAHNHVETNPDLGLALAGMEAAHRQIHHSSERLELHLQRGGRD
jgi:hypothetical protein